MVAIFAGDGVAALVLHNDDFARWVWAWLHISQPSDVLPDQVCVFLHLFALGHFLASQTLVRRPWRVAQVAPLKLADGAMWVWFGLLWVRKHHAAFAVWLRAVEHVIRLRARLQGPTVIQLLLVQIQTIEGLVGVLLSKKKKKPS